MAATRLIPMHLQKSRSMGQCLKERTDYAKNDEKTEAGQFVSSYECDPSTVDLEFEITKNQYAVNTGRNPKEKDVIAYQIRQSFKPGETTPEEANQIGYETAMRWTKGKHAFIVATHVDKAHIHSQTEWQTCRSGQSVKEIITDDPGMEKISAYHRGSSILFWHR